MVLVPLLPKLVFDFSGPTEIVKMPRIGIVIMLAIQEIQ